MERCYINKNDYYYFLMLLYMVLFVNVLKNSKVIIEAVKIVSFICTIGFFTLFILIIILLYQYQLSCQ